MLIRRPSMSDAKPPSMTYGRQNNILTGLISTIEALGRPPEPPDAKYVVIVSSAINGATAIKPWK